MRTTRSRGLALAGVMALVAAVPGATVAQDAEAVGNPYDTEGAIPGSGEGYRIGYLELDPTIPFVVNVTESIKEQAEIAGAELFVCSGSVPDVEVNPDFGRQFA